MLTRALKQSQQLDEVNSTHICFFFFDLMVAPKCAKSLLTGVEMLKPDFDIVIDKRIILYRLYYYNYADLVKMAYYGKSSAMTYYDQTLP